MIKILINFGGYYGNRYGYADYFYYLFFGGLWGFGAGGHGSIGGKEEAPEYLTIENMYPIYANGTVAGTHKEDLVYSPHKHYWNNWTNFWGADTSRYDDYATYKETLYFGTDALGSVRTTSSYSVFDFGSINYDVFRTPYRRTGSFLNSESLDFGYLGKQYNADTQLYDYGFRDYYPKVARFSTQDPIRDGINWYAYCGGDPINKFDPNGLSTCVDEKTGTIISAANDNDCGVYAFPTVDGQRVEGPGFPIGLTGTPGYFAPATPNTGNIQISGQDTDYIGQNISNYGSGFAYGDFQYETPINNANNVTFTPSTFSTWAHKKEGDFLTQDEANLQMAIGGVEMGLGFAGIFFTGGTQVQTGAFVMADGAIVLAQGSNKIKCTPFYHLANDFLSPNIAIPNYKIQYVSPLP